MMVGIARTATSMALAALLHIHRVTGTTSIATVTPEYIEDGRAHVLQDKHVPS